MGTIVRPCCTDVHERADVKVSREKYLLVDHDLAMRTALWIQVSLEDYANMKAKHAEVGKEKWRDVEPPHYFKDEKGVDKVEVHIDQFEYTGDMLKAGP